MLEQHLSSVHETPLRRRPKNAESTAVPRNEPTRTTAKPPCHCTRNAHSSALVHRPRPRPDLSNPQLLVNVAEVEGCCSPGRHMPLTRAPPQSALSHIHHAGFA